MWTPDVYEGSPTPVTAFLTSAPKTAAFVLWIRLMVEVFPSYVDLWQTILMALAIASMVLGAFLALMQTNIKRLLAYSTISHMGFALLGLLEKNFKGVSSVLLYLTIYLVMAIGIFAFVLNLRKHGKPVESIEDFAGLSKENPLTAFASALILFSLAGLPPFAGFFAKLNVFMAAVQGGFYKTAVIGLIASVIASAYYLKVVKIMYFDQSATNGGGIRFDRVMYSETLWIMILSALVVSTYVFYPDLISAPIETALRGLGGSR
jgi:NADH-quinone oxidoreductase subunit N